VAKSQKNKYLPFAPLTGLSLSHCESHSLLETELGMIHSYLHTNRKKRAKIFRKRHLRKI